MGYLTHAINDTGVIYGEAGAAITAPAMKVVAFDSNGKFVLPASGTPVGVILADAADVAAGDRLNVQIKDICYALAGANIKRGDNLKAHTDGTVKPASAGDDLIGIALSAAASGKPVEMMIVHCICGSGVAPSIKLGDLTDVDLSTPATDGQVLKYDNASSKWKAANDATE